MSNCKHIFYADGHLEYCAKCRLKRPIMSKNKDTSKVRRLYQRWKNLSFFQKMFWVFTVAYLFTIHSPFYMCALFMLMLDAIKRLEAKLDEHMKGGSHE